MGIAVPLVLVNLLTPPCDCALCLGLRRREAVAVAGLRLVCPDKQLTLIHRQPEIGGMEQLEGLGRRLYEPAMEEVVHFAPS
jgi:hypothetical protein